MDGLLHFCSGAMVIGRDHAADLHLEHDPSVALRHAVLAEQDGGLLLEPLDREHPPQVAGQALVEPLEVSPGLVFVVGKTTLEILSAQGGPEWT